MFVNTGDILEDIAYKDIISPSNLFSSKEEVINFLEIEGTIEDLEAFLKVCEEEELYEYCSLIKDKINNKTEYEKIQLQVIRKSD